MPRSRAAALYDRKSSVTNRSGTKAYFFSSFLISSERHACLLLDLDQHIENFALGVDGAPQIDHPPIDFQIDLVKMAGRMRFWTALAQVRGDHRPKVVHPAAHGLVGDAVPRSASKSSTSRKLSVNRIEPNRLMYDLGREPISGVADFPHALGYSAYVHPTTCRRRDKALRRARPFRPGSRRCQRSPARLKQRRYTDSRSTPRGGPIQLGVEFGSEKHDDGRDPHPRHHANCAAQRAIGSVVVAETCDVPGEKR